MAGMPLRAALRHIHHLFTDGSVAGLADAQLLERFLARRDESAFTALVERHGPLVLATCRSVLHDPDSAEDAFQATFLILVRKAGVVRNRTALGGWLHRVARRVAVQANTDTRWRRHREQQAGARKGMEAPNDSPHHELAMVLHEEIDRLADRHRLPLVLCYLEELSHAQAALQLRWSERTLRRRLAEARERLRSRLVRRGVAIPVGAGVLTAALPGEVTAAWTNRVVQAALAGGAQGPLTGLVNGVLRAMFLAKLKTAATIALTITAALAIGVHASSLDGGPASELGVMSGRAPASPPPLSPPPEVPRADPDRAGSIVFRGFVFDPVGQPYAGAHVHLFGFGRNAPFSPDVRARSFPGGHFRFDVPRADFDAYFEPEPWREAHVIAAAEGFGLAMAHGPANDEELELRLVADDVPIAGRILDLQGQPVAGATVRALAVKATDGNDLSSWLDALRTRKSGYDVEHDFFTTTWYPPADSLVFPPISTDADGRFRITGIGRERLATLSIEGPSIESVQVNAMTRSGPTIRVPGYRHPGAAAEVTYVGARFDHAAGPTRPIEGTVRDKSSGQPLAGIRVRGEEGLGGSPTYYVEATTDAEGHYRLLGLPRGREGGILALPTADQPFIRALQHLGKNDKAASPRLDFDLTRGVRVVGRITEKATGRPVKATVDYFVFVDNPHLKESSGFRSAIRGAEMIHTGEDGSFAIIALPGPGVVVARALDEGYLKGVGADAIPDPDHNGMLDTYPYYVIPTNYHVIAAIDPPPGAETLTCDLAVDSGRTMTGTVLGPDRAPLSGALAFGLYDMEYWEHEPLKTERFTLNSLRPGKPRLLQFVHADKKLAGWLVVQGAEDASPVVKLEPWGVVTGRLVDEDGQPRSDAQLVFSADRKNGPHGSLRGNGSGMSGRIVPSADGRFRIEGLAPGLAYSLRLELKPGTRGDWAVRDLVLKPGETRDLGDVRAKSD